MYACMQGLLWREKVHIILCLYLLKSRQYTKKRTIVEGHGARCTALQKGRIASLKASEGVWEGDNAAPGSLSTEGASWVSLGVAGAPWLPIACSQLPSAAVPGCVCLPMDF